MICEKCNQENPPEARYCHQCGSEITQQKVAQDAINKAIKFGGERRQVSIMFCDLVGSTQLSNQIDIEDLRNIITIYQNTCQAVITRQQGFIARYLGDGILVYFGYPKALGDDAVRAVRAGLEIIQEIKKIAASLTVPFQVRIGIETGQAVIGDLIGEGEAREVSVIGETPNIAARLQGIAKADSVVIGPATKHLVNDVFALEHFGSHHLKGISNSLDVWTVLPDSQLHGNQYGLTNSNLTQFSARESELECIENKFAEIRSGYIRIVNLSGEDGIGKSRLILQFIEQHQNDTLDCWKGQCSAIDETTPYFVFIQCLRQELKVTSLTETKVLHEALKDHLKVLGLPAKDNAPYLLNLLDARTRPHELEGMSSDVIAHGTTKALKNFIIAKAKFVPLVLVLEDLQWIDSGSELFIEELIKSEEKAQLLILCSFRSDYSPLWNQNDRTTTLIIHPLLKGEINSFLQKYFGTQKIDSNLVNLLEDKTNGNPLFIEEFLRSLLTSNQIKRDGEIVSISLSSLDELNTPNTLQYLLLSHIDRLDHDNREILQIASVIGRQFPTSLLSVSAHLDSRKEEEFYSRVGKEQNIISCSNEIAVERCKFSHALIQETLYNNLLREQREILHLVIGETIEDVYSDLIYEWVEALAYHFSQTTMSDKAVKYLAMSAEKALDIYSLREAKIYLDKVLPIIDSASEEIRLQYYPQVILAKSKLEHFNRDFYQTTKFGEKYLDLISKYGNEKDFAMYSFWLGYALLQCGVFKKSRELLMLGLGKAEELNDAACIAYTLTGLAWVTWMSRFDQSPEAVPQLCNKAIRIANDNNLSLPFALAMICLGFDRASRGLSYESRKIGLDLLANGRNRNDIFMASAGYNILAWSDASEEEYELCIQNAEEGLKISQTPIDKLSTLAAIGTAKALMGHGEEGFVIIEQVRKEASDLGMYGIYLGVDIPYGASMIMKGEMARGINWIKQRIGEFQKWGNDGVPILGHIILGEIYLGMLTREQKLPFSIVLRNIMFLLRTLPAASKTAMSHFKIAEDLARANHAPGFLARTLVNMAQIYVRTRQFDKAYNNLVEVAPIAEKLKSKIMDRKISLIKEMLP